MTTRARSIRPASNISIKYKPDALGVAVMTRPKGLEKDRSYWPTMTSPWMSAQVRIEMDKI